MIAVTLTPTRWQRSRKPGAKQPDNCRYCGRGTPVGNPYKVFTIHGKVPVYYVENKETGFKSDPVLRQADAHHLAAWLFAEVWLTFPANQQIVREYCAGYEYLSCFCDLDLPCHVDTIIEFLQKGK